MTTGYFALRSPIIMGSLASSRNGPSLMASASLQFLFKTRNRLSEKMLVCAAACDKVAIFFDSTQAHAGISRCARWPKKPGTASPGPLYAAGVLKLPLAIPVGGGEAPRRVSRPQDLQHPGLVFCYTGGRSHGVHQAVSGAVGPRGSLFSARHGLCGAGRNCSGPVRPAK